MRNNSLYRLFSRGRGAKYVLLFFVCIMLLGSAGVMVANTVFPPAVPTYVTIAGLTVEDIYQSIVVEGEITSGYKEVLCAPAGGRISALHAEAGMQVQAGDILVEFNLPELEEQVEAARQNLALAQPLPQPEAPSRPVADTTYQTSVNSAREQVDIAAAEVQKITQLQLGLAAEIEPKVELMKMDLQVCEAGLKALDPDSPTYIEDKNALEAEIVYLQAEIITINSPLLALGNQLKTAKEDLERYQSLVKKLEPLAQQEVKQNEAKQREAAKTPMVTKAEENRLAKAKLELEAAQENLAAAQKGVRAPFNGVVAEMSLVAGQKIERYSGLLELLSTDEIYVTIALPPDELEQVYTGMPAQVKTLGRSYEAEIIRIGRMAVAEGEQAGRVKVTLSLQNPDTALCIGVEAEVTIITHRANGALLVPETALLVQDGETFCYVLQEGAACRKAVRTGLGFEGKKQVLAGLHAEDIVIVNPAGLEEGQPVSVNARQGE